MAKAQGSAAQVLRLALASRLVVLTLIALWRLLCRPYDTSASLNPPCLSYSATELGGRFPPSYPVPCRRIAAVIESSVVWDGVYFVRIAECGYEYEQTYAFLPLLPAAISLLCRSVFSPLIPWIGYRAVLVLSGYFLNNVAFVLAAVYFYRLSVLILDDSVAALRAAFLFSFNPASIFYSSIYSESLYALFSLGGLFYLFSGANAVAMILLALSGSARSNGALHAGYFCFQALLQAYTAIRQKQRVMAVWAIIAGALRSIFIFVPFLAFQAFGYSNICLGGTLQELRPWCKEKVPLLYGFLQSHYWGVGFLRYFQLKQLPNFLLASPVISLAVCTIVHYVKVLRQYFQSSCLREEIISVAEMKPRGTKKGSDVILTLSNRYSSKIPSGQGYMLKQRKLEREDKASEPLQEVRSTDRALYPTKHEMKAILLLPFVLHLAFMTFMAFLVMHVQVSTRFLSASPPIYWFASNVVFVPSNSNTKRWGYFILVYLVTYILLGSLLFSNFYPFT